MNEKKPVKNNSIELKLSRPHPAKAMRLGRHLITQVFAEYELNEKEVDELNAIGGRYWFCTPEQEKEKQESARTVYKKKMGRLDKKKDKSLR